MNATRKVKLKDIKSNLSCKLCLGYLVDATTIIECLHSFCKSCIITYLDKSADLEEKYCPVCDVQLHSTKPLTSIRSDLMLQEIVYKLVPGLFKNEMRKRREFYGEHEGCRPVNPLDSGQVFDELYITSDDVMHLSMEYMTDDEKLRDNTRRYLKCPAAVSIFVLKKLLQGKYDLDADTNIDVMFGERTLPDDFLLMDVAYKYSWTKNGNKPLSLRYRIKDSVKPIIKLERTINDSTVVSEPLKSTILEDTQTITTNKKKVCNENGSNIMSSEEIKNKPIKLPTNGLINGELAIAPIKHPNGKIKGRKRKNLNYSDIVIESKDDLKNLAKRLKLENTTENNNATKPQSDPALSSLTQLEITPTSNNEKSDGKEVQLQISENGVMSARSVSCNGDDKVVYDKRIFPSPSTTTTNTSPITPQNISLTEKLLLSGNFHSKTGPSGVTEIICDKPDPSSSAKKTTSAKPGYVTLNIPTPKNPINGHFSNGGNDNGNQKSGSVDLNSNRSTKTGEKTQKTKAKQKMGSKERDGETVINGLTDLRKVCTGTSMEATDAVEVQRLSGKHSLPIIPPMTSPFQQRTKILNGTILKSPIETFVLPAALNFSPASGMSVSMIPCTTSGVPNGNNLSDGTKLVNNTSHNNTPPKRAASQSCAMNGELKYPSTPKPILPKLNGDQHELSPKKPPKFFKSRRTSSPGMTQTPTTNNGKQHTSSGSPKHESNESKRKTPVPFLNGGLGESTPKKMNKERRDQQKETSVPDTNTINFINLLNTGVLTASPIQTSTTCGTSIVSSSNGLYVSRPLTHTTQVHDKYSYSQHLTALNNLAAMQTVTDPLNSGLGIAAVAAAAAAAAASNGNGLPLGMTPFVTDSYCSLPFLNQRHPMAHMTQFPFAFNLPGVGFTNLGSTTNLTTATTTPVNSSKPKSSNLPSPGNNSGILNGLLTSPASTKVINNDSSSTLDLSVGKSNDHVNMTQSNNNKSGDSASNPLLVSLLNSCSKKKSPSPKPEKASKTTSPDTSRQTSVNNNVKSHEKSKSPLIRQLLEKKEENERSRSISPEKKDSCVNTTSNSGKIDGNCSNNLKHDSSKSPANGPNSCKHSEEEGPHTKSSLLKPEMNDKKDGKAVKEPKSSSVSASIVSPKLNNDSDVNTESTKVTLDSATLLSLSAQNNNNTLSNNHDKSPDNISANKNNLDSSNNIVNKDNVKRDSKVPSSPVAEIAS